MKIAGREGAWPGWPGGSGSTATRCGGGTDRIEAALRLVVMIMLVTAVPAAAAGAAVLRARSHAGPWTGGG